MGINLGDIFPNFSADSTIGKIQFHDFIGDSWAILFSHPADFTPVCTTELARVAQLADEFAKRNTKLAALSCDSVASHNGWVEDVKCYSTCEVNYPIIADEDRKLATQLGMIDPEEKDAAGLPLTARAVFIIGPDKRMKLSLLYPATTGRSFDEVLRVLDSLQLTAKNKVATPVDWKKGDKVMVVPSVTPEEAKTQFPNHTVTKLPSGKGYLRMTDMPQ